jgi:hypothetical protein
MVFGIHLHNKDKHADQHDEHVATAGPTTGVTSGVHPVGTSAAAQGPTATSGVRTGATTTAAQSGVSTASHSPAVCAQEKFTVTEDRPEIKERVTLVKEHRPVERQMVREVRATGEERVLGGAVEHLGTQERIVSTTPRTDCPGGVCAVPASGGAAQTTTTTTTTGTRGAGMH